MARVLADCVYTVCELDNSGEFLSVAGLDGVLGYFTHGAAAYRMCCCCNSQLYRLKRSEKGI